MKTPTQSPHQFRQGDVLLVRIAALPAGAVRIRARGRSVILADGELTGHAHRIPAVAASCFEAAGGARFLHVGRPAQLTHEEHAAITLEPGFYAVVPQREYSPAGDVPVGD